jgi:hypothetical protein
VHLIKKSARSDDDGRWTGNVSDQGWTTYKSDLGWAIKKVIQGGRCKRPRVCKISK